MHINLRCVNQTISVSLLFLLLLLVNGCAEFLLGTPKASFTCSPNTCYCQQQMTFDASGCLGGNDEIVQYAWAFGDGTTASGARVTHGYPSAGTYQVRLSITTEHGQQALATRSVHIAEGLVVPTVYPTIQAAIDAAENGDVVVVLPGTYQESITFRGKAITVQSTNPSDPSVVAGTVILGAEPGRSVVNIGNGSTVTLAGFTIKGGGTSFDPCPPCAGGVYIREASPTIRGNHIVDHSNGAMAVIESDARIVDNLIANNTKGSAGAGIYIDSYLIAPSIVGNTFENNTAPSAAGIYITATSTDDTPATAARTVVSDNTFTDNTSTSFGGAAIFVEFSGNLLLDTPDSNTYSGNAPDNIFYTVPPT